MTDAALNLALWGVRLAFLALLWLALVLMARALLRDVRAATRDPAAALGRLVVVASAGQPPAGAVFALDAVTTLGRDLGSSVVLDDPYASAQHAVLTFRGSAWYVEDLGSTNGTYVARDARVADRSPRLRRRDPDRRGPHAARARARVSGLAVDVGAPALPGFPRPRARRRELLLLVAVVAALAVGSLSLGLQRTGRVELADPACVRALRSWPAGGTPRPGRLRAAPRRGDPAGGRLPRRHRAPPHGAAAAGPRRPGRRDPGRSGSATSSCSGSESR